MFMHAFMPIQYGQLAMPYSIWPLGKKATALSLWGLLRGDGTRAHIAKNKQKKKIIRIDRIKRSVIFHHITPFKIHLEFIDFYISFVAALLSIHSKCKPPH